MSAKRIPAPSAPKGSMLWLIQLAHFTGTGEPRGCDEKIIVLSEAEKRRDELSALMVPMGLIDFVTKCETPWAVLAARLVPQEYVTQARKQKRHRAGLLPKGMP